MEAGHTVAGRYRLVERIGSGGNGAVWRAVDEELDRDVALKRALAQDDQGAALLRREARILARLNHPNVVTVHDLVLEDGAWWLVMEYVPARSLAEHGVLPPERVTAIGKQLARGLDAVHEARVLHRDVKPSNVLLSEDGQAKLGDFGISRSADADITISDTGLIIGTPAFVAPEVANGEPPSRASDVFSLGATLYAAVEGRSPYGTSSNPMVLLRRAMAGKIDPPRQAGELGGALASLMRRDPERRPTAAAAERLLRSPTRRPRRGLVIALACVAAALLITAALLPWYPAAPPPAPRASDPRLADPCALVEPTALSGYGEASRESHYGNFNRCDVIVRSGKSEVDVRVELVTTAHPAESDTSACSRSTKAPAGYAVEVTAIQDGDGPADLCAMAGKATGTAAARLAKGPLPARALDPASLARASACALLKQDELARIPGLDTRHPEVGFGNWECRWRTSGSWLLVRFDQDQPLGSGDGRHVLLAGHDAYVEPDGYGEHTCVVKVVHRELAAGRQTVAELLLVAISGGGPSSALCEPATEQAEAAAARLPATSARSAASPSDG